MIGGHFTLRLPDSKHTGRPCGYCLRFAPFGSVYATRRRGDSGQFHRHFFNPLSEARAAVAIAVVLWR
jgi:hypothetical protein